MGDLDVLRRIGGLVDEQLCGERLRGGDGLAGDELARTRTMEVALEWWGDVPRERCARGAAGADPDGVAVRPDAMVEGYAP
ncbi:MAG: DUF2630 family protein [Frankiaceae bacterium]